MVFALVFARGAVNALDNPARQSFVTELVGAGADRQRGRAELRDRPHARGSSARPPPAS